MLETTFFQFLKQQDTPNFRSAITHEEKNKSNAGNLWQLCID